MRAIILSVVPSPYQRDLLGALADTAGISLEVLYLEKAAPDSPWPEMPLRSFERVLPGRCLGRGMRRCHFNWGLPDLSAFDAAVVNVVLTAWTGQVAMRRLIQSIRSRGYFGGADAATEQPGAAAAQVGWYSAGKVIRDVSGKWRRASYRERFPKLPMHRVPYFCEIASFGAAREAAGYPDIPTFLFCGQMIERKAVDVLLEAFGRVRREIPAARLILAGREGDLPKFLAEAESRDPGLGESVENAGFVAPADLPGLFAQASCFVLPSRHDGWGVVVNQAIGSGLPVIASDAVGASELIEAGVNGCVVPAGDAGALADAMLAIGADATLRASMSQAARVTAAELAPQAGAARLAAILQSLKYDR
ncbi:MAG: glycosyltransferase family 4 protein [Verrucomicrobiales bacterium]